jgi:hypothetical protein
MAFVGLIGPVWPSWPTLSIAAFGVPELGTG